MSKPIISLDIDDVLVPHFRALISWYNRKYGTQLTLEHNHPTDPKPWGTDSVPEAIRRVRQYFDTEDFRQEQPYDEATAVLKRLTAKYELVAITGRDEIIQKATEEWLEKHFQGLISAIHFTSKYSLEGKKRAKVAIALEVGARYFIDDNLEEVNQAARAGLKSIIFGDYPWNQSDRLPAGITRCNTWQEVQEYFDAEN